MTNTKEFKTMNTQEPTIGACQNPLVSEHTLNLQDEYYAKRRLPAATPAGAEDRTYCFRVEFEHDLYPLSHMLKWAAEAWWSSPICPWGDADVKVTLKPETLSRDEIRWLFARVGDCHVPMETVELERDYTGERKYTREEQLEVKVPSPEALKASLAGLSDYREALSIADDRAIGAEVELEVTLEELVASEPHAGARWPESPVCHCSSSEHGPSMHAMGPASAAARA